MDPFNRLLRLGVIYTVIFGAVAVIYPFIPIYFQLRGFAPSRIGLLLAAIEISGIIAPFLVSRIADRTGRFRTVIAGMIFLAGVSLIVLNRLSTFSTVLFGSLALGFFMKPVISLTDALTGRSLADSSKNYGRVRVWGTVSFIAVSLVLQLSGVLESGGFRRIYFAILTAMICQFLAVPAAPPVPAHHDTDTGRLSVTRRRMPREFTSFLLVCFVGNIGYAVYQSFGTLYFSEIAGVSRVSGLIALAAFSEIPAMLYGGRLIMRLGHRQMLSIAMGAGVLRLTVLAMFPSIFPVALSQLTHAFTYGFFFLAGIDLVNKIVPARQRALGMGLFMSVSFSGALLVGSTIGGFLLEAGGYRLLFGSAVAFPVSALIWLQTDPRFRSWETLDV